MFSLFKRKIPLALATSTIFVAGIGAGLWRYRSTQREVLADLRLNAERCAIAFESEPLDALNPDAAGPADRAASDLGDRLARLARTESGGASLQLFRLSTGEPTPLLLAHSAPAAVTSHSGGLVRPTPQATESLRRGQSVAEGPIGIEHGAWVSGYAPIAPIAGGVVTHAIALHLTDEQWRRTLWNAAAGTAGYVWIFLILPLTALVSTRRNLQQRDALRNLTQAMEQGQSAVMIVSLDRRIEYVNAGLCRQIGYERRELIGREWREFEGPDTPADLMADLLKSVRAGLPWTGEWTMRRKDGSFFPVRGAITPVKDRGAEIRNFVAVFEDVTEIRRTESVLREAKERAEAGDRAKGQFLATMSHEVRTPLNGIVGFASLLLETELTPEQQEFVETIRTSSETLIQLTGDILDYARIESGRLKLEAQPCDARECVENALDLAAAAAVQKNIELLHWVDETVPPAIVADVSRLRQVIVNLVNNAVKFTANGEVEVRVRSIETAPATASTPPWCVLEVSVRDTGIGIAPEHHGKIFKPFSQVDDSTTRRFGGTGLGLAICKNIVELMDGKISFVSEPDRGSTFTFTVRVAVHVHDDVGFQRPMNPLLAQCVAIASESKGLSAELARLSSRLGAKVLEVNARDLAETPGWSLAIVDVSGAQALELAATPPPLPNLAPEKMIALVPILLPGELRSALRGHFRIVLNKPLHHEMLSSLLATPSAAARTAPPAPTALRDLHVLIVEDNPVNQQLVQKMITNLGCRWTCVSHGRAALEQLGQVKPDVVLMDLHMPELDGLSAITRIRAGDAGAAVRDVWIIALTADARGEQRQRTLAAGANDYLTKPVHVPAFVAALNRFAAARKS